MIPRPRSRRAFATLSALILMAIVGVALEALAMFTTTEARRTRFKADDAQLQSLLLAGADVAKSAIQLNQTTLDVPLPKELTSATLRLTRIAATPTTADFQIQATLGNRAASEHVRFIRHQQVWSIDQATLDP